MKKCTYIYGWFSQILPTGSLTFFQRSTILQQFQSFSYLKFIYWRNIIRILAAFFSLYYHVIQQFILSLIFSRYFGYKLCDHRSQQIMIFICIKKWPNSLVNKFFCDTKDHIALIYIFETQITLTYIYLSYTFTSSSTIVRKHVMLRF